MQPAAAALLLAVAAAAGCRFEVPRDGALWTVLADPTPPADVPPAPRPEGARPLAPGEPTPAPGRMVVMPGMAANANTGVTYGLMPVWITGEPGHTQSIFAPSLTYNEVNGLRPTARFYRYLLGGNLVAENTASHSTEGATNYRFRLLARDLVPGWDFMGIARSHRELGSRFYGFGARTHEDDETSYRHFETSGVLDARLELTSALTVAFAPVLRVVEVRGSAIDDILSTRAVFAGDPGVGRYSTAVHHRLAMAFRTIDRAEAPVIGVDASCYAERVLEGAGADFSSWAYGTEVRGYVPVLPWMALAMRGVADYVVGGSDVPFYERAALGGQDLLRGFPEGRFVDDGRVLGQIEARFGTLVLKMLGGAARIQLAPFLDVGRVFPRWTDLDRHAWQPVGGIGIRLEMPPSTRGRLDIGVSREGFVAFLTLGYPF